MHIGIDVSLTAAAKTGLPSYARSLVGALARVDPKNRYTLYRYVWHSFHPEFEKAFVPKARNFQAAHRWLPKPLIQVMWDSKHVDRDWLVGPVPDVYFSPFHSTPGRWFPRFVSVFHDVAFRVHPEFTTEVNREYCETQFFRATCLADRFVTVSHYSKSEMVNHMGVDADRIDVVHEAADPFYRRMDGARVPERMAEALGDAPLLLYVGSVEPRKNLDTLLKALAKLHQDTSSKARLVIAGGSGWKNESVYAAVEELGLQDKVYFTGYVTDEELLALYNVAAAFCYPTIYEGFGLPVIEAMACGTPVITTRVTSIPEVGGDAVRYIDEPKDVDSLAHALAEVTTDAEMRADLSRRGEERAATFSWDKAARETLAVLEKVHSDTSLEPRQVRVGEDERGLVSGFYENEPSPEGHFRWMKRRGTAKIMGSSSARAIRVRAAAAVPPEQATMHVRVQGRTLGTCLLTQPLRDHTFELPFPLNDALVEVQLGVNRQLELQKGGERRELAARVQEIRLLDEHETE